MSGLDAPSERRTFVSIEVEMGFDDEWHQVGLDEAPESAEALLAELRKENNNSIADLIENWSLDDFVTVSVVVRHNDNGTCTQTTARWSQP